MDQVHHQHTKATTTTTRQNIPMSVHNERRKEHVRGTISTHRLRVTPMERRSPTFRMGDTTSRQKRSMTRTFQKHSGHIRTNNHGLLSTWAHQYHSVVYTVHRCYLNPLQDTSLASKPAATNEHTPGGGTGQGHKTKKKNSNQKHPGNTLCVSFIPPCVFLFIRVPHTLTGEHTSRPTGTYTRRTKKSIHVQGATRNVHTTRHLLVVPACCQSSSQVAC